MHPFSNVFETIYLHALRVQVGGCWWWL